MRGSTTKFITRQLPQILIKLYNYHKPSRYSIEDIPQQIFPIASKLGSIVHQAPKELIKKKKLKHLFQFILLFTPFFKCRFLKNAEFWGEIWRTQETIDIVTNQGGLGLTISYNCIKKSTSRNTQARPKAKLNLRIYLICKPKFNTLVQMTACAFVSIYILVRLRNYITQALTENCIVCRSQRTEVVLEPALVDVPEDLLVVDPTTSIWIQFNEKSRILSRK